MKRLAEILLSQDKTHEIMMGNWGLVRAMIEANVRVVTSYPGSPTPEIATAIAQIPKEERPFYFEFSVNEKVATEVAFGASINGHLSCVFFKSVGLNVAADSLVQLGLMELIGGMVIILGDDPGANSSQNEQDNRHFAKMSYIPIYEPSTPTEAYQMFKEAAKVSQERQMPVFLRLTTHVCHYKELIEFDAWHKEEFDPSPKFNPDNGPYIPITTTVFPLKRKALKKLQDFGKYADESPLNFINNNKNDNIGIITMGLPYYSLLDVMEEMRVKPDILKLGIVYPLAKNKIIEFLKTHKEVKILEELDDVVERDIKMIAFDNNINVKISGKGDLLDWENEYTPDKVKDVLRKQWPSYFHPLESDDIDKPLLNPRPAQMCPGCGHRSAFHAIKKALGEDDITVADIGCHSLGFLPPYRMGQALLCMGHSNGTAAGLSLFNKTRKVVSFIGDSTFFHAGLPGIVNAIFNNHNHTLIIMENGTTAMTGHQDHPAVGKNFNEVSEKIPVMDMLKGMGVTNVRSVDTYQQAKLTQAVKDALAEDGFNVVIAKHPCMLKFTRELAKKKLGNPPKVKVTAKCNRTYECISEFACPSYQINPDGSVWVQEDLCIGDGSCKQTCPSQAIESKSKEEK